MTVTASSKDSAPPRHRRSAARVAAVLLALFWALPWFGLIDLLVVFTQRSAEWRDGYLLESGWGLLYLVLVCVPTLVLVARPGDRAALAQLSVCAGAVLVGGVWATARPQLLTGLGMALSVGLLAVLGGPRSPSPSRPRRRLDRPLLALAVVALAGAVVYGTEVIADPVVLDDITNGVDHHGVQASLALAIAGCAALSAFLASRLPLWCATVCAAWLGVESLVYPDLDGSLGTWAGAATLAWSACVLLLSGRP